MLCNAFLNPISLRTQEVSGMRFSESSVQFSGKESLNVDGYSFEAGCRSWGGLWMFDDYRGRIDLQIPEIRNPNPLNAEPLNLNAKRLNPKPLNPIPLKPKPLNPKPLNPKLLNLETLNP